MTTNVIDAATGEGLFATPGGGERTLLLLLAARGTRDIRERSAQEDVAIDAEDALTQADEALVIG